MIIFQGLQCSRCSLFISDVYKYTSKTNLKCALHMTLWL